VSVTLAPIRPVLTIADICDLLRLSLSQFKALRASGFFDQYGLLIEVQPQIDRKRRYRGEPFVKFLSDQHQIRLLRDAMRAVEDSGLARASGGER
jgi:hypothetical protein